jgi:hypothetical protein
MDDLLDFDDDFTFEPTAWDLAMNIGLRVDPETDRAALDELADAMLVWASDDVLEPLTDVSLLRLWDGELESMIREGLEHLASRPDWSAAAQAAIEALDRDAGSSEVGREVIRHLAMQLGQADQPLFACLCCIDEQLEATDVPARREPALRAALLARRNACVTTAELHAAAGRLGTADPVVLLATTERREAVRRRLARIGRLGSSSMPALSAELTRIAAEPLPAAADDDVWRELCTWMLSEAVMPEQN